MNAAPDHSNATRSTEMLYGAAGALAVLAPVAVAAGAPVPVRAGLCLLFFCLTPGAAIAAVLRLREPLADIGVIAGVGLAALALSAQFMLAVHRWDPAGAVDVLAVLSLLAIATRMMRSPGRRNGEAARGVVLRSGGDPNRGGLLAYAAQPSARARGSIVTAASLMPAWYAAPAPTRFTPAATADLRRRVSVMPAWLLRHGLVCVAALALWAFALAHTIPGHFSGFGLLSTLPWTYYAALALLVGGFGAAVFSERPRDGLLALYVVLVIVVLHGTTAVLYAEPRYSWVYKHIGVISYIAAHGSVNTSADIYQNWPAFFALNTWFSTLASWGPLSYAAWAQVFFEVLNVAALVFALRALTQNRTHIWVTCLIFILANWVGQDYLAPQAFGFFEGLVVVGLLLRVSQRDWPAVHRIGVRWNAALDSARQRLVRGPLVAEERAPAPVQPFAGFVMGSFCFLAIAMSHQLSPFMVAAVAGALAVFRWCRPLWLPVQMAQVAGAMVLLAWPFISAHFQLFSPDLSFGASPVTTTYPAAAGAGVSKMSELLLIGLVALLSAAGVTRRLRAGHWDAAVAGMAVAPFVLASAQAYGGEAMLRAFLFALPWLAFLAASFVVREARGLADAARRWPQRTALAGVAVALAALCLPAYFGQESVNFMSPADIAVNHWYGAHAQAGSVIGFVDGNSPARLDASYADMSVADAATTLLSYPTLFSHQFRTGDVAAVERILQSEQGTAWYLVVSPSQVNFLRYYGLAPAGWVDHLVVALRGSTDFRLVYERGSAYVFELATHVHAGRA